MLTKGDREILEKTAQHAMQFIFDNDEDVMLCQLASVLVGMMHAICERERQALHGVMSAQNFAPCASTGPSVAQLRGISG